MGKIRRQRRKFHLESGTKPSEQVTIKPQKQDSQTFKIHPEPNPFQGLEIDISSLTKKLPDDVHSVKSLKSVKSDTAKILPKKEKLKIRREMLMQKFDVMAQEKKLKKKKKTVVGDLNPLKDALPSLESLLKSRKSISLKQQTRQAKKRGIEKKKNIKKSQIQGIKMFQQILKNKHFQKNPQEAISHRVKVLLEHEKSC